MPKNAPGFPQTPAPRPVSKARIPQVVFQPQTYRDLYAGMNIIGDAIRPTLGPYPRLVALEKLNRSESPEILDDGATIARRIIAIQPRSSDVGAMLMRNALWKMHTEVGDGTTTMGVLYQSLVNEGIRAVAQMGCNAMLMRAGFSKGLVVVVAALQAQATMLEGREQIAHIALGMCQGDDELADVLGEIYDIVGADGMIVAEKWNKWGIEREYVEGTYWDLSGYFSRLFLTNPAERQVTYEDAAILISDLKIKDAQTLIPVLEKCVKAGIKRLVVIAAEISDAAIGLLVNNNRANTIQTVAVRTPRIEEFDRVAVMQDVAVLTGGKVFYTAVDAELNGFQVNDLGQARRIWASESQFGLFGGKGDPRQVRQHLNSVRRMLANVDPSEAFQKTELQKRVGRLLGGSAILRLGAPTDAQTETRKELANRAISGLRNAVRGGVVAGGGAALIQASEALCSLKSDNEDEAQAYKVLARALQEPLRVIAANSGYLPDLVIEKLKMAPAGWGFDARSGEITDIRLLGVLDAVTILIKAVEIAVNSAAMALTTDIIIHHAEPKETIEP